MHIAVVGHTFSVCTMNYDCINALSEKAFSISTALVWNSLTYNCQTQWWLIVYNIWESESTDGYREGVRFRCGKHSVNFS